MTANAFKPFSRAILGIVFAVSVAACGDVDNPEAGVLVIPYELGNLKDCESLGVEVIRGQIDDEFHVEEVDCEAGQIRFNQLMPGSYEIELFGLDEDAYAIMDSLAGGPRTLSVVGEGTTVVADPPIKLTAAPAHLKMRWDFGFGTCDSAFIDHFTVSAWRVDGSELLLEEELDCGMPGDGLDQYRSVPDGDRQLSGDEFGEVAIQAYDGNDVAVGSPLLYSFEAPGAGRFVHLSMTCDQGGCAGSGTPD